MLKLNTLSGFGSGAAGAAPSATNGYHGGPQTVNKLVFATSVMSASTDSTLSLSRSQLGSMSDTTLYGYWIGGGGTRTADRIVFATDVTSAHTDADLSADAESQRGFSDGDTAGFGYIGGGANGGQQSRTERLTFSTGVMAVNTDSDLSQSRTQLGGVSDNTTHGYWMGGYSSTPSTITDRIVFASSVTTVNTDATLPQAVSANIGGVSDLTTYGYSLGGQTGSSVNIDLADRITYSTSVTAAHTDSNLPGVRRSTHGFGDATYGFVAGGYTGATVSTTVRMTFSTGVLAAHTDADLTATSIWGCGISDGNA